MRFLSSIGKDPLGGWSFQFASTDDPQQDFLHAGLQSRALTKEGLNEVKLDTTEYRGYAYLAKGDRKELLARQKLLIATGWKYAPGKNVLYSEFDNLRGRQAFWLVFGMVFLLLSIGLIWLVATEIYLFARGHHQVGSVLNISHNFRGPTIVKIEDQTSKRMARTLLFYVPRELRLSNTVEYSKTRSGLAIIRAYIWQTVLFPLFWLVLSVLPVVESSRRITYWLHIR